MSTCLGRGMFSWLLLENVLLRVPSARTTRVLGSTQQGEAGRYCSLRSGHRTREAAEEENEGSGGGRRWSGEQGLRGCPRRHEDRLADR